MKKRVVSDTGVSSFVPIYVKCVGNVFEDIGGFRK